MTDMNWEYDAAWQEAWQQRSCPPEDILFGDKTIELAAHLDICPTCRDLVEIVGNNKAGPLYQKFGSMLGQSLPKPHNANSPVAGQVWSLKNELGGWGPKMRYYAPPLVLLLANIDEAAVKVAQLHEIPKFKQKDDVSLGDGFAGFAESWNNYTLDKTDLSHCWGRVKDTVVGKVVELSQSEFDQIPPNSLLYIFRQLEIETGFFFSSQSVGALMRKYEKQAVIIDFFDQPVSMEVQKALNSSLFLPPQDKIISIREYLLKSKPADELEQHAAAGELVYCSGPFLTRDEQGHEIVEVIHGSYEQPDYDPTDNSLALRGTLENFPAAISNEQAAFGWLLPDNRLIAARDFWFEPIGNGFQVIFAGCSGSEAEKGSLSFCLVDSSFIDHE